MNDLINQFALHAATCKTFAITLPFYTFNLSFIAMSTFKM